jgi:hypothetical protein
MQMFLVAGDIADFVSKPQYRVNAIIASTNVLFDLNGQYPLVQTAIFNALPQESREQLVQRFQIEADKRFSKYNLQPTRITDVSRSLVLLDGAAVESLVLAPISGNPSRFCFLATDYPTGGTATLPPYVEFNKPERISVGVATCLSANGDAVASVVMPLIGAATSGQISQWLRACRMRNALIGDLDGLGNYLAAVDPMGKPIQLREVGIVVWDRDMDALDTQIRNVVTSAMLAIFEHAAQDIEHHQPPTDRPFTECK